MHTVQPLFQNYATKKGESFQKILDKIRLLEQTNSHH